MYLLDCSKCSKEKTFFLSSPIFRRANKRQIMKRIVPKGQQRKSTTTKRHFSPLQYHIWREFVSKIMNPNSFLTSVCFKDQSHIIVEHLCMMVTLRKTYEISLIYFGTFFVSLRLFQNKSLKIKCVTHIE